MTTNPTQQHRRPYVGEGEDGALRSADIDRTEAEGLDWSDPRKEELYRSADRWEAQAHEFMLERVGRRPDLAEVRASVGNEDWLAALALLELSPVLNREAESFTCWSTSGTWTGTGDEARVFNPDASMDWDSWITNYDTEGRGWSSTEHRLFGLIASLIDRDRPFALHALTSLGSWETDVWRIITTWATGGNNREFPGRLTITPR